jgi:hypothetical protein
LPRRTRLATPSPSPSPSTSSTCPTSAALKSPCCWSGAAAACSAGVVGGGCTCFVCVVCGVVVWCCICMHIRCTTTHCRRNVRRYAITVPGEEKRPGTTTFLRYTQRYFFQRLAFIHHRIQSWSSSNMKHICEQVHRPRRSTGMKFNNRSTPRIPPPASRLVSRHPPWPFRGHRSPRHRTRNHPCPRPSGHKPFLQQADRPTTIPRDDDGAR